MNFAYIGPATTDEEALSRLRQYHPYVAVDTETIAIKGNKNVEDGDEIVSTDAKTCIGVGVAIGPEEAFYFPLGAGHKWKNVPAVDLNPLRQVLESPSTKVFFNSIFDLDRIEDALGIDCHPFQDLAIATNVQGLWNALDQLVGHILCENHTTISEVLPKRKTMLDLPFEVTSDKCMHDCMATYRLYELMKVHDWLGPINSQVTHYWQDMISREYDVTPRMKDCYRVDLECIPLLRKMSKRGITLRQDRLDYWYYKISEEQQIYEDYFAQIGFRPSSPVEVGMILAERGNWLPRTKGGKQLEVNEDRLLECGDPLGLMVLSWRRRNKLKTTYIVPIRGKERAYTHFRLDLATGRTASSDINMQNIPGSNYQGLQPAGSWNVRDVLAPDNGIWTWIDFSQIEMRIIAHQSHDEVMLGAYNTNNSVHEITQQALWPSTTKKDNPDVYTRAKTFNFAMIYDAQPKTLAKHTGLSIQACEYYRKEWFDLYSGVFEYILEQKSLQQDWVETDFGRRCRLPIDRIEVTQDHIDKCKVSYADQGTGADVLKRALLELDKEGYEFPLQVHDEVVFDGDYPEQDFPDITHIHPRLYTPWEWHQSTIWE